MQHIIPPELAEFEPRWHFTPVVRSRGLLLLSGFTGVGPDGAAHEDPATQFEGAFDQVRECLAAAGAGLGDVVEMTTYHVGLREHLDAFVAVKDRHVVRPFPAWSAIGVDQLITDGALVEIRVVAEDPSA
ncbi:hypothetical protein AD006_30450 (plasmid) [Pseudonocardia sp. EC080610-09]|uniref:RidA family protein n=1 Tax=unclassified Pseudonocardia TaxID=2619320 RepID=UPI0007061138|nr:MULTISPECIES: RidA family protein [unclassified Pseudonocardia]ALL79539.1 hypothetical protein AD006_30450 [Pseudonocardia sp. EC080610-09]ALL85508.1 hypothetical protein AD017_30800 [Pseudonocardia sp. EC080619-01]